MRGVGCLSSPTLRSTTFTQISCHNTSHTVNTDTSWSLLPFSSAQRTQRNQAILFGKRGNYTWRDGRISAYLSLFVRLATQPSLVALLHIFDHSHWLRYVVLLHLLQGVHKDHCRTGHQTSHQMVARRYTQTDSLHSVVDRYIRLIEENTRNDALSLALAPEKPVDESELSAEERQYMQTTGDTTGYT